MELDHLVGVWDRAEEAGIVDHGQQDEDDGEVDESPNEPEEVDIENVLKEFTSWEVVAIFEHDGWQEGQENDVSHEGAIEHLRLIEISEEVDEQSYDHPNDNSKWGLLEVVEFSVGEVLRDDKVPIEEQYSSDYHQKRIHYLYIQEKSVIAIWHQPE